MDTNQVIIIIAATAAGGILLLVIVLFLFAGGDGQRLGLGLRSLGRVLRDRAVADQVALVLAPPPPKVEAPSRPSGVPLRMLAVLQREGRLLDFLLEDVQAYQDAQIGAAVRDIHRQCQGALREHLDLAPVIAQPEGATVDVPAGFDPSAIRVTGNVTGNPPFRGILRHHGWRVRDIHLAQPPEGQDELVLQPAEVELS